MDKMIKQYADSKDLTSLKYIFVDSLDVDPTFERYEESYNYCKTIPGLLEQHMELTPFVTDPTQWTETYWVKLKMDLKKNFSDQRMSHMRKVAKVLLADKVQRLLKERQSSFSVPPTQPTHNIPSASTTSKVRPTVPTEAEQAKVLEEAKRQLEAENRRIEAEQAAQERARKAKAAALAESQQHMDGASPKKAIGIALAVVAVAVVTIVALVLLLK